VERTGIKKQVFYSSEKLDRPEPNFIKLFRAVNCDKLECLSLTGLPLCLWARPGAYLRSASLRSAPASLGNIRLGWKGLQL